MSHRWCRHTLLFLLCASATLQPTSAQTVSKPAPAGPKPQAPVVRPKTPPPAPTPPQLLRARTAYLVNNAGGRQPFDDVSNALRRWRRWRLVERADAADILVSLASAPVALPAVGRGGKPATAKPTPGKPAPVEYQISIQSRGNANEAPLWRDVDQKPARLVERLRDEVDGPPSICFAFWCK